MNNVSQRPNLRHLCEPLGGTEGLLEKVGFKKTTECVGLWWRTSANASLPDGSEFHTECRQNFNCWVAFPTVRRKLQTCSYITVIVWSIIRPLCELDLMLRAIWCLTIDIVRCFIIDFSRVLMLSVDRHPVLLAKLSRLRLPDFGRLENGLKKNNILWVLFEKLRFHP